MALDEEKRNKIYEEERIRAEARREYSEELDNEEEYEEPKKKKTSSVTLFIIIGVILIFVGSAYSNYSVINSPEYQAKEVEKAKIEASADILKIKADSATAATEAAAWKKNPAKTICDTHPTWTKDDCQGVYDKKIWVGMSYNMLVYEMGKPDHINTSNYGRGNEYQYCWDDYNPGCFYDKNDDGIIESYN